MKRLVTAIFVLVGVGLISPDASGFCGFYVSGADAELYNNATMVSLMRDGKRTVLSMQNNYEGPAKDFAMVVPVPVVLKKKEVKTLPEGLFASMDALSAPRLVEYWERDPCAPPHRIADGAVQMRATASRSGGSGTRKGGGTVTIEAQFDVGEYQIVILSSTESTALENWLIENDYNIPDGAAPYFRPYIQKGQYFFVAKVNIDKVEYSDGEAILSPIRFHYDSDDFTLPVRLGLINSKGAQDLIAFILARDQRYEVANLPSVEIPTNLPVKPSTKKNFAHFYRELFDNVLKENPQAVVTEYSWNAASCDPCPKPPLKPKELMSLGADVLPSLKKQQQQSGQYRNRWEATGRNWTLTRLHTRYGKHTLGEDLVFEKADPIMGGRGMPQGPQGKLGEQTATESSRVNNFQGRYVIRHFWEGEIDCEDPKRGMWGGPTGGDRPDTSAASNLAFSEGQAKAGLAAFIEDQKQIPGLEKEVASYNEPAGDVVDSWGKLVEPPKLDDVESGTETPENESDAQKPGEAGGAPGTKKRSGCASGGGGSAGLTVVFGLAGLVALRRQF